MSRPRVAVVMGSDSDWSVMQACASRLKDFGLECDVQVLSAHRTPEDLATYVTGAREKGIEIFIAAAGMSAALAGTIAAQTTLPVIGVPIDSGSLGGIDALLSTVQMPAGVPVAGMAVGEPGAINAAVLAAQVLALKDETLTAKVDAFKQSQAEGVRQKNREFLRKL